MKTSAGKSLTDLNYPRIEWRYQWEAKAIDVCTIYTWYGIVYPIFVIVIMCNISSVFFDIIHFDAGKPRNYILQQLFLFLSLHMYKTNVMGV